MSVPERVKPEPLGERNGSSRAVPSEVIRRHIKDLLSDDFGVRSESISSLEQYGEDAARALISTMTNKTLPSQAMSTISHALEGIGKPSLAPLVGAIANLQELNTPQEVFLLESFIAAVDRIDDRSTGAVLLEQLAKLRRAARRGTDLEMDNACESARVRIHVILGRMGERGGLGDLLRLLGDGRHRARDGVVQTLARIGDARAVPPLVRLHRIESGVSSSGAHRIREAIRDIVRREHLSADDPAFSKLSAAERSDLEHLFPKTKNGTGNGNGNGHANGNGNANGNPRTKVSD